MTFRNTTKAKLPFLAYVYLHNIPKGKKIGKHLAYLAYIFNAFFSFWGDLGALVGALVVLFLWVTGHHLGTYQGGIATLRAIVSDDLGLSTPQ